MLFRLYLLFSSVLVVLTALQNNFQDDDPFLANYRLTRHDKLIKAESLVIAHLDNTYWKLVENGPGKVAKLNYVFWFDVDTPYLEVEPGTYQMNWVFQATMELPEYLGNEPKATVVIYQGKEVIQEIVTALDYPTQKSNVWQVMKTGIFTFDKKSRISVRLQNHSGTQKSGMKISVALLERIFQTSEIYDEIEFMKNENREEKVFPKNFTSSSTQTDDDNSNYCDIDNNINNVDDIQVVKKYLEKSEFQESIQELFDEIDSSANRVQSLLLQLLSVILIFL